MRLKLPTIPGSFVSVSGTAEANPLKANIGVIGLPMQVVPTNQRKQRDVQQREQPKAQPLRNGDAQSNLANGDRGNDRDKPK